MYRPPLKKFSSGHMVIITMEFNLNRNEKKGRMIKTFLKWEVRRRGVGQYNHVHAVINAHVYFHPL